MVIESLQLLYHLACFRCCVCQAPLGNGLCGTDVRVRNTKLHCTDCYSNDEGKCIRPLRSRERESTRPNKVASIVCFTLMLVRTFDRLNASGQ